MVSLVVWLGLLAGIVLLFPNNTFVTMEYALTILDSSRRRISLKGLSVA